MPRDPSLAAVTDLAGDGRWQVDRGACRRSSGITRSGIRYSNIDRSSSAAPAGRAPSSDAGRERTSGRRELAGSDGPRSSPAAPPPPRGRRSCCPAGDPSPSSRWPGACASGLQERELASVRPEHLSARRRSGGGAPRRAARPARKGLDSDHLRRWRVAAARQRRCCADRRAPGGCTPGRCQPPGAASRRRTTRHSAPATAPSRSDRPERSCLPLEGVRPPGGLGLPLSIERFGQPGGPPLLSFLSHTARADRESGLVQQQAV